MSGAIDAAAALGTKAKKAVGSAAQAVGLGRVSDVSEALGFRRLEDYLPSQRDMVARTV